MSLIGAFYHHLNLFIYFIKELKYNATFMIHPVNLGVSVHQFVKLIINELFF